MPVKSWWFAAGLGMTTFGCGPEAGQDPLPWMVGTFSSEEPGSGEQPDSVLRYVFEADGTFRRETVASCGSIESEWSSTWEAVSETRARAVVPDEQVRRVGAAYVLERLGCNEFAIRSEHSSGSGNLSGPDPLVRGAICLRDDTLPSPDGSAVPSSCAKEYCDGEPPDAFDCEEEN